MADTIEIEEFAESVVLFAAGPGEEEMADSLSELAELARTAGASVAGTLTQRLDRPNPATYLGSGKVEELSALVEETGATGVICDDELTPAQLRNLSGELEVKVMDRTLLILDIFAAHATTSEGMIQVEMAQLKYRSSRLAGLGRSMSRLGGGIGTRGPGEKRLETDRRIIRDRISQLGRELRDMREHREVTRAQRKRAMIPVAAIVGYTNAGKSTLLNRLTGAGVLEEDKLFATLDPTTRILELPGKQQILLTDTVGFIRKLPHHLIEAFRSTLEEARYADVILHVIDASNPQREKQAHIVYETLRGLGIEGKTVVSLFNKQDAAVGMEPMRDGRADYALPISAREGTGLGELVDLLVDILRENKVLVERTLPYDRAAVISQIRKSGELLEEDYRPDGIYIRAYVPMDVYGRLGV